MGCSKANFTFLHLYFLLPNRHRPDEKPCNIAVSKYGYVYCTCYQYLNMKSNTAIKTELRNSWKCVIPVVCVCENRKWYVVKHNYVNVDKKNQLDVTFCILYFSSNSCSTCFGQPCAHHWELTTAWCYSLVLVCAVAAGRLSRPVGR